MDWGSLAGLLLALGGIAIGQVLEGGRFGSLLQPAAFFIVVCGTAGAVLLQSGLPNFRRGLRMARWVLVPPTDQFARLTRDISAWSHTSRREGLLSLQKVLGTTGDPLMEKGLQLIVDGVDPFKVREILETEISAYEARERMGVRVWESAGGYAPTVGILGAVLGLIQVMEHLTDPARLGGGIAVAFVATIYGVGLANLVFLPIAGKLKAILNRDLARREALAEALSCVASGENPRMIEERLAVFLPKT
jgi:chemotaxis protein MotA